MPEGHRFDNISANDSTHQHVGNAYNTTNHYYASETRKQGKRLLEAAQDGQLGHLQQLINKQNVSADYEDDDGLTALHCAAWGGHLDCIEFLLQSEAYVNAKSDKYGTPLCLAAFQYHSVVVKCLLESHGADPIASGGLLGSPLQAACISPSEWNQGAYDTVTQLLRLGAQPGFAREMDSEFTKQLRQNHFPFKSYMPRYPLLWGADYPALHLAVKNNPEALVGLLLYSEADVNVRGCYRSATWTVEGVTPLMTASESNSTAWLISVLVDAGASLLLQDSNGSLALMWAADNNACSCVFELVKRMHTVDQQNKFGKTALMHAAERGYVECLELLLSVGAKIDLCDNRGRTAVDFARRNNRRECIKTLTDYQLASLK